MLLSRTVLTFVNCIIRPNFLSVPFLFIILPLALKHCTTDMTVHTYVYLENTITLSTVLRPLTLIDISIGMYQPPISICHIVKPIPFIVRAISPKLTTSSCFLAILPLSFIHIFAVELYRGLLDSSFHFILRPVVLELLQLLQFFFG